MINEGKPFALSLALYLKSSFALSRYFLSLILFTSQVYASERLNAFYKDGKSPNPIEIYGQYALKIRSDIS
jgi:hypothetical protein